MLDQAIQKFALADYLLAYGADQNSDNSDEWILTCPDCGKEKLTVNIHRKAWHCWVCQEFEQVITPRGMQSRPVAGAGGLLDLIQLLEECDRATAITKVMSGALTTAIEELASIKDVSFDDPFTAKLDPLRPIDLPENPVQIVSPLPFMLKREISMEDVHTFGLFWCYAGRYSQRMIFPVFENRNLVYYQGRAMWDPIPGQRYIKSLNPPKQEGGTGASEILMNLDVAAQFKRVCLVEGPTDLVRVGRDAVCTFGKQIHPIQIAKLLRAGVEAIDFMWDGPSPKEPRGAWDEMTAAATQLSSLFDVQVVYLPKGDPGDYPREQLQWMRREKSYPMTNLESML